MKDKLINDISNKFIYVDNGSIIIADSIDSDIIYWDEFEDMIKPEFRN